MLAGSCSLGIWLHLALSLLYMSLLWTQTMRTLGTTLLARTCFLADISLSWIVCFQRKAMGGHYIWVWKLKHILLAVVFPCPFTPNTYCLSTRPVGTVAYLFYVTSFVATCSQHDWIATYESSATWRTIETRRNISSDFAIENLYTLETFISCMAVNALGCCWRVQWSKTIIYIPFPQN